MRRAHHALLSIMLASTLLAGCFFGGGSPRPRRDAGAEVDDLGTDAVVGRVDRGGRVDGGGGHVDGGVATVHGAISVEKTCTGGPAENIYVAITTRCGDWTTITDWDVIDQTSAGGKLSYSFSVASGTHYLSAFLDCNGNANAKTPAPDAGDIRALVNNVACVELDLKSGSSLDIPVRLNDVVK